jgi:hypothetical protein
MDTWIHLATQSKQVPHCIDATIPPRSDQLLAAGWRKYDGAVPLIPEGYERLTGPVYAQDPTDPERCIATFADTPIQDRLDREATQAAADRAALLPRWILENAFLLVCQQYFGTLDKKGTKELLAKAFDLIDVDTKAAMVAFGVVVGLDKELVREVGDRWWDSCEWHDDAEAIAGARQYLGLQ